MAEELLVNWLSTFSFDSSDVAGRKIAIYSEPGIGKTVLAARLGKRNLIVTDEDGYTSLSNHPELNSTWTAIPFRSWSWTRRILPLIESGEYVHEGSGEPFDNIIFDTMSGMIADELQQIVDAEVTTQQGKISKETAARPEYLVSEARLLPMMRDIAQFKRCSVTMLFHLRTGDKLTPGASTRLDAHAAAYKVVNKYTSVIAYLTINKDGQRWLRVMPKGDGVSVKTRYHFPSDIVTDDDFVAHIEEWKKVT